MNLALVNLIKVYMTDFFLFVRLNLLNVLISVAKKIFSIAIFLPRVLMCQKRQISLPVGKKPRDQKQETGNDCDVNSGLQASRKTDFSHFLILS